MGIYLEIQLFRSLILQSCLNLMRSRRGNPLTPWRKDSRTLRFWWSWELQVWQFGDGVIYRQSRILDETPVTFQKENQSWTKSNCHNRSGRGKYLCNSCLAEQNLLKTLIPGSNCACRYKYREAVMARANREPGRGDLYSSKSDLLRSCLAILFFSFFIYKN